MGVSVYQSPVGPIFVGADDKGVRRVCIGEDNWKRYGGKFAAEPGDEIAQMAARQLEEYFKGERKSFSVPLAPEGSEFCIKVWEAVSSIPYGQTRSYGEIALSLMKGKAARAVGMANRINPIPIFIPCHRVIGKGGKLTGYMGKRVDIKKALLELEGALCKP